MKSKNEKMCSIIRFLYPLWACGLSKNSHRKEYIFIVNATISDFISAFPKAKCEFMAEFSDKYYTFIVPFDGCKYYTVIKDDTNKIIFENFDCQGSKKQITNAIKFLKKEYNLECKQRKKDIGRGVVRYIDIKGMDAKRYLNLFPESIFSETEYSGTYKTTYLTLWENDYPVVVRDDSNFINEKTVFRGKELTPSSLNITGTFFCGEDLKDEAIFNLKRLKEQSSNQKRRELCDIMIHMIAERLLSEDQMSILELHKNQIEREFGEILCAYFFLLRNDVVKIEFSKGTSAHFYDFIVSYNSGAEEHVNVKSGDGSGQSFRSIHKYQINNYRKHYKMSHKESVYINSIELLSNNKKGEGISTILNVAKELTRVDDMLGKILLNLLKDFSIKEEEVISISDYNERLSKLIQKHGGKKNIGLLSTKKSFIENEEELNKCLSFSISTLIREYSDNSLVTKIMTSPYFRTITSYHVAYNEKSGIIVNEFTIEKSKYSFHYWGNVNAPTNNMLGYKVSF